MDAFSLPSDMPTPVAKDEANQMHIAKKARIQGNSGLNDQQTNQRCSQQTAAILRKQVEEAAEMTRQVRYPTHFEARTIPVPRAPTHFTRQTQLEKKMEVQRAVERRKEEVANRAQEVKAAKEVRSFNPRH
jgi:hypothetical protein